MSRTQNRVQERLRQKIAKKRLLEEGGAFKEINLTETPHPAWMTRAFQNNHYVVTVDDNAPTTAGKAIKVMIQRVDDGIIENHWAVLQRIKNEIFGAETVAVEYYPAESKLINDHNVYWIWIFPEDMLPIPVGY